MNSLSGSDYDTSISDIESNEELTKIARKIPSFDTKCGEVLLSAEGEFRIICDSCGQTHKDIGTFSNHILIEHLKNNTSPIKSPNPIIDPNKENYQEEYLEEIQSLNESSNETDEQNENNVDGSIFTGITGSQSTFTLDNKNDNEIVTETIYVCSYLCGKTYKLKTAWMEHEYRHIHNQSNSFICTVENCKKKFYKKSNYDAHLATHNTLRPFKCDYCLKAFKTKTNRRMHHRRHEGVKPYPCDYCGKRFLLRTELEYHHRVHRNERPSQCELCGKSYRNNQKLNEHLKRHKNQKDWKCNKCDKLFFNSVTLRHHQKSHFIELC